jgi:uncharacterized GH25 family protein
MKKRVRRRKGKRAKNKNSRERHFREAARVFLTECFIWATYDPAAWAEKVPGFRLRKYAFAVGKARRSHG